MDNDASEVNEENDEGSDYEDDDDDDEEEDSDAQVNDDDDHDDDDAMEVESEEEEEDDEKIETESKEEEEYDEDVDEESKDSEASSTTMLSEIDTGEYRRRARQVLTADSNTNHQTFKSFRKELIAYWMHCDFSQGDYWLIVNKAPNNPKKPMPGLEIHVNICTSVRQSLDNEDFACPHRGFLSIPVSFTKHPSMKNFGAIIIEQLISQYAFHPAYMPTINAYGYANMSMKFDNKIRVSKDMNISMFGISSGDVVVIMPVNLPSEKFIPSVTEIPSKTSRIMAETICLFDIMHHYELSSKPCFKPNCRYRHLDQDRNIGSTYSWTYLRKSEILDQITSCNAKRIRMKELTVENIARLIVKIKHDPVLIPA
jgi:hypothetical protein